MATMRPVRTRRDKIHGDITDTCSLCDGNLFILAVTREENVRLMCEIMNDFVIAILGIDVHL